MRIKRLILGLCLGGFFLGSCSDELSQVGTSIQGDEDKISVSVDTFRIEASTINMEAVYAKTDTGLLGEIFDPLYGTLKSDYICQFYCPEGFRFKQTPINGKIDSVDFRVFYNKWVGDSLAPMRAQIYPVVKPLERNFYTNIDPEEYSDMSIVLGSQTYTAYDMSVPDSIRNATDYYGNPTFAPVVTIRMPIEIGQKFYDETINNPSTFSDQQSFNEFFPGLYITNTFGTGNILNVITSYFTIYYKYMTKDISGADSIGYQSEIFNVTKEVFQLNRFKNTDMSNLLEPDNEYSYLKTPAGVCTQLVIPASEITAKVSGRILNNMPLTLYAMPQEDYEFKLNPPTNLLLIQKDSVKAFFEEGKVQNGITTFVSTYNASTRAHVFGNISNLLKDQMENTPDKDLVMWVIPVNHEKDNYYGYTTSVSNYLFPSAVKLRKDEDVMKIVITSSKYGK